MENDYQTWAQRSRARKKKLKAWPVVVAVRLKSELVALSLEAPLLVFVSTHQSQYPPRYFISTSQRRGKTRVAMLRYSKRLSHKGHPAVPHWVVCCRPTRCRQTPSDGRGTFPRSYGATKNFGDSINKPRSP